MRFRIFSLYLGVAAGLLLPAMVLADNISWNGGNGNWDDPTKWDKGKMPGMGDNAFIVAAGTYTVTLNVAAEVATLTLGAATGTQTLANPSTLTLDGASTVASNGVYTQSGGTLTGAGMLTVNGLFNWSGGTQSGSGVTSIAPGATLAISGDVNDLRSISIAGTATWSAGNINSGNGAQVSIQNGGLFAIQSDAFFVYNLGGDLPQVSTQVGGTVTKSIAAGTTTFTVPFSNHGSVMVNSGVLALNGGGSSTGAMAAAGGARVDVNAGTHTFNAGAGFAGPGALRVNGGTLTVAGDVTVANLEVMSGTLDGDGTLTGTGNCTWSGGTQSGSGVTSIAPGATLAISGDVNDLRSISIAGTATWSAGNINSGNGAQVSIQNGGLFAIQSDAFFVYNLGGDLPQVSTQVGGTVTKSIAAGTTTFGVPFSNHGSVMVNSGVLALNGGGSSTGAMAAAVGARVDVNAGTHTFNAGAGFAGPGALRVNGGTLTVAGDVTVANLEVMSGTLDGDGTLTGTGNCTWSGGTQSGSGVTSIAPGATLAISGDVNDLRSISIAGTATWSAGNINSGNGAQVSIQNGGLFAIQSDAFFVYNLGGDLPQVSTQMGGTVTKSIAAGTTTFGVPFSNHGTVMVNSGVLALNGGGSSTGAMAAAVGARVDVNAGTHTFNAGAGFTGPGALRVNGGTLTVAGDVTVANLEVMSGTLDGDGTLTGTGNCTWSGGTQSGSGVTSIAPGATLAISGDVNDLRSISIAGTAAWSAGNINSGNGAQVSIQNGGLFAIQSDAFFAYNLGGELPQVSTQVGGTVTKSIAGGTTTFGVPFSNSGTVNAASGTLSFTSYTQTAGATHLVGGSLSSTSTINIQGGILDGHGTVAGDVSNAGQVNPGSSPGVIDITGDYTQAANGILNIELNGLTAGTQFDQLNLVGAATLAGTLNVSLGFAPTPGNTFIIVNNDGTDTVTGTFSGLAEGTMFTAAGGQFQISYAGESGNDVVLTFLGGVPVTSTPTGTIGATATPTPTSTAEPTTTVSPAPTASLTATASHTRTPTPMSTSTATAALSATPTQTTAPTATATQTPIPTATASQTRTAIPTTTASATSTATLTAAPTQAVTQPPTTSTVSPTSTASPTVTATTGTTPALVVLAGRVLMPGHGVAGTNGQVPVANARVEMFLCQARTPCLNMPGDPVGSVTTDGAGNFSIVVPKASIEGTLPLLVAHVSPTRVLRAYFLVIPVGSSASSDAALLPRGLVDASDIVLDTISEAAVELLAQEGTENYTPDGIDAVQRAVRSANANANFEDLTLDQAIEAAVATAAADPTVEMVVEDNRLGALGCIGDCNRDGMVTVDELIKGVNIALGSIPIGLCAALDQNGSGQVEINELILGVNNALNGCPASATPTGTPTSRPPTATSTPTPTFSPTPAGPTVTPGDQVESISGGTTIVANAMSIIPSIVGGIVSGIQNGGAATAGIAALENGGAAGACPLGGTATRTGSFPSFPLNLSITLSDCKLATVDGSVTYTGTASIQGSALHIDITARFEDTLGTETLTAQFTVNSGTASLTPSFAQCVVSAVTLNVTNGQLSATSAGKQVGVTFQSTRVAISISTFNASCVPTIYRMTFNGPAALLASDGEPIAVTFTNFIMDVDDHTNPTTFDLSGEMASPCFGGAANLSTPQSLEVPSGKICPTAGVIRVTLPTGMAGITYQSDSSVDIDDDGNGTTDRTFPNCLDPRLLMCAM